MTTIGVTLLSGGLDSTIVSTYARNQVDHLTALTFHYGQTHSKEIKSAEDISQILGIHHKLVDISSFKEVAWFSSLTNPDRFPIPQDRFQQLLDDKTQSTRTDVPSTYVSLRNTFLLVVAGAFLESEALFSIESDGMSPQDITTTLFIAPNAIDYSGYPDCRPEYYDAIRETMMRGSKLWTQYKIAIEIETPIIHLTKAEIVRMGIELNAPLAHTWSCYQGDDLPCGRCDSCILRAKGFEEAGISDPLSTRLGTG